jgi:hypothetical protein
LRFQIDPTPEETRRACGAIAKAILPPNRAIFIIYALYALVMLAGYFLTPATPFATGMIGVVAIATTLLTLQQYGRFRVRGLRASDPHARETHFVELSPQGVHSWCAHIDARYPWSDFAKVCEDREFYLFVRPSGVGVAIPKRLLDSNSESELRSRICEWADDHGASLALEDTRTHVAVIQ